jgi:activator of HSP90 ATPase
MQKKRPFILGFGGAAILIASFGFTYWLTEPDSPEAAKIKSFAASTISDEVTLRAAAAAAGLVNSTSIKGNVDELRRIDANKVRIVGWTAETSSLMPKASPITVMGFSAGKNVFTVETIGERRDVTVAQKLTNEAAKNVVFSSSLTCSTQEKLLIVSAALSGTYAILDIFNCP